MTFWQVIVLTPYGEHVLHECDTHGVAEWLCSFERERFVSDDTEPDNAYVDVRTAWRDTEPAPIH